MFVRLMGIAALGFWSASQSVAVAAFADPGRTQRYDPNERICESVTVLGSRLAKKRVCASRSEWEVKRRMDREVVEDAQKRATDPCNSIQTHTGPAMC